MNTVFVGGSRHVSRLPAQVKERLHNIVERGHHVIVGDAAGADKAVQKYLSEAAYGKVTVFCSGERPRNNVGHWTVQNIVPPKSAKGFAFYAAKDREMAREADVGLMIWDGKSPGTVLNVLRLVRAGKMAVLMNVPEKTPITIKSTDHWQDFLTKCSAELQADLRERATPEEWDILGSGAPIAEAQLGLLDSDTASADIVGRTDLAKVDAPVVALEEYDEITELTEETVARAVPGAGLDLARCSGGQSKVEHPKRQVTMRLDGDVIEAMRASGPGWQARANDVLRERFKA